MPTIQIYDKSQVDALIASAGGLPDPTSASAGDVLTLDSNKAPEWSTIPDELPATTSASAGDVLALDSNKDPAWVAPSGGGGMSVHTYTSMTDIYNDIVAHFGECIVLVRLPKATTSGSNKPWIVINKIYLESTSANLSSIVGITDGTVCYHLVEIIIQNNGNFARQRVQGTGTYSGSTITYLIVSSNNGYNMNLTYEDFKLIY